jgi:gamma-glutamyltranspeptidase / glutathione hydrolase
MEVWNSRRSTVYSTKGMVACTQPLAASIGKSILENGGTAADAAVAMAAALNVVEPCSTGIGGDAFALYYQASSKEVKCYMGNGCAPEALTLELLDSRSRSIGQHRAPLSQCSGLTVTVPGAAALWEDLVRAHGALSLENVLSPAADLAENGFVLGPVTARQWANGLLTGEEAHRVFRPGNRFSLNITTIKLVLSNALTHKLCLYCMSCLSRITCW